MQAAAKETQALFYLCFVYFDSNSYFISYLLDVCGIGSVKVGDFFGA